MEKNFGTGSNANTLDSLVRKPKTKAGKRHLEKRAAKVHENDKTTIFIRGSKTSKVVEDCLMDFAQLKKPNVVKLTRKNSFLPFDDDTPFEKFCEKYDASLFCFVNHTKKRPHNLVLGRMYDFHVLDMFEFGVEQFASISSFKKAFIPLGIKPCLIFKGDVFQNEPSFEKLKSLLIDFFRGATVSKLRLQGVEYVMTFTVVEARILIRTFKIVLKRSGSTIPRIELQCAGPSMDLVLRRQKLASDDLYKTACRIPLAARAKKIKNVEKDVFGSIHGRVHLKQQSLSDLKGRKIKALKIVAADKKKGNVENLEE